MYDNLHIYLRETALHAAVRKGHLSVIGLLLNDLDGRAMNYTNSAGRLPQHEAAHLNKYNALEALLNLEQLLMLDSILQYHHHCLAPLPINPYVGRNLGEDSLRGRR